MTADDVNLLNFDWHTLVVERNLALLALSHKISMKSGTGLGVVCLTLLRSFQTPWYVIAVCLSEVNKHCQLHCEPII